MLISCVGVAWPEWELRRATIRLACATLCAALAVPVAGLADESVMTRPRFVHCSLFFCADAATAATTAAAPRISAAAIYTNAAAVPEAPVGYPAIPSPAASAGV